MDYASSSLIDTTIGETYDVLCIQCYGVEIPVLGDAHQDEGNDRLHFHIDLRFITRDESLTAVECDVVEKYMKGNRNKVLLVAGAGYRPEVKKRKCLRQWPMRETCDGHKIKQAVFIKEGKEKWRGTKLDCMKCPHRGTDLTNAPIVNGRIYCPAHGLEFNSTTFECIVDNR